MSLPMTVNLIALLLVLSAEAQGTSSLWTSWIPLVVRSPYLSTWMNATNVPFNASDIDGVGRAPTVWPQCLENQHCSVAGLIRIDQTRTFAWLASPSDDSPGLNRSVLTNIEVTPTRTIMNMTAGPLDLSLTFLSPIEPSDPVLQSLPFAYMWLEVTSNDGQQHDVQVYADITGEWLSSSLNDVMTWSTQATDALVYHQMSLQTPLSLTESSDQAKDGSMFFAMPAMPAHPQTFMVDTDVNCRGTFVQNGNLTNQIWTPPHIIGSPFPEFAISADLGTITPTSEPFRAVWIVGMTRDPAVAYTGASGSPQPRSPYWVSQFNEPLDAVTYFAADYSNALVRAIALDQKILAAAASLDTSGHYADIVSLAARQAMSGTELTIGRNQSSDVSSSGQWNMSDVKMFMKNVGTDGRVNPVEGLYEAFPFFLYINPTYGGWLLSPVLEFAITSQWTLPYAPRDIGLNYPNATGNTEAHIQGVEQSGNMLIMTLAHARATGDGSLISLYYELFKKWADYLVENTLPLTAGQQSADTIDTGTNLTNVALKGIIGIQAMAEMSVAMNLSSDARIYSSAAASFAALWQAHAVSSDGQHILTNFGDPDSSTALTYNLFADKLLSTNIISSSLYDAQTASVKSIIGQSSGGLPIDQSLPEQANSVWSMFTAAYTEDPSVRSGIIDQIWERVSSNTTDTGIFSTAYRLDTGAAINNFASPSIGGVFAPLSLNTRNITISVPGGSSPTSSDIPAPTDSPVSTSNKSVNAGAIAGGLIGGLGAAALLGLTCFVYRRRRGQRCPPLADGLLDSETGTTFFTQPVPYGYEPPRNLSDLSTSMTESSLGRIEAISNKTRGVMQDTPRSAPLLSPSSSGVASSQDPSNSAVLGTSPGAVPTVQNVQDLMENLWRVMQTLQERDEPPPGYNSEVAA